MADDIVFSLFRVLDMLPNSPKFIYGGWVPLALRVLHGLAHGSAAFPGPKGIDLRSELLDWNPEIVALDEIGFGNELQFRDADGRPQRRPTKRPPAPAMIALM